VATRKVFISPVFVFFLVYYFTLRAMVGLAACFMHTSMFQGPNFVYLIALSQLFVAWLVCASRLPETWVAQASRGL
jgi:uncharacterized membrane protein (DUF485 family)